MPDLTKERLEFALWWKDHGQFCRAGGGDYEQTFAWAAWQAARAALSTPAVPAGHVLVPVEPTRNMRHAAVDAICYGPEGGFTRTTGPDKCWRAMLAAAPQQPAEPTCIYPACHHNGCLPACKGPAVQGEAPLGAPIAPEHDAELAAMSAEAEARFTEMAQNAARYRALRDSLDPRKMTASRMPAVCDPMNRMLTYTPAGFDAALDAAMAQGGE